jgi:hypothetical protein
VKRIEGNQAKQQELTVMKPTKITHMGGIPLRAAGQFYEIHEQQQMYEQKWAVSKGKTR